MTRIQNLEYRIQKAENAPRGEDAVVPPGRTSIWAGFPGTLCLANIRCRFATLPGKAGRAVEKGGKAEARKWEKAVQDIDFFPDNGAVSRLFPRLPGFSHLFPLNFYLRDECEDAAHPPPPPIRRNGRKGELLLGGFTQGSAKTAWRNHWANCCNLVEVVRYAALRAVGGANFCGKNYGFLRIFPQCFTILRTDQGRIYAILRIFTGGSLFWTQISLMSANWEQIVNHG